MRFHFVMVPAALIGFAGCASSQTPAVAPGMPERAASEDGAGALPRYFSVTISTNGGLLALGQPTDERQLQAWATQEAQDASVAGAAVTAEAGVAESQALAVITLLVRSGFKHVVFSSRDGLVLAPPPSSLGPVVAPSEVPPAVVPVVPASEPEANPAPEPEPEPAPLASTSAPRVEVKQLGLHIGGGPNNEREHAVYATPIQRRFGELQQCYALATPTRNNASFGVDLLISTRGGTAKIKDYRTSLGGKEFHLCVLGVFGSVEFPARDKATVVSYSVLFKPL